MMGAKATSRRSAARPWTMWGIGIFAAVSIAALSLVVAGAFAPNSRSAGLLPTAPSRRQRSIDEIDHGRWDALLQRYVDAAGLVDYRRWKGSPTDVAALDEYLSHLSNIDLKASASREAKLACWINAYNALTIRGILQDYSSSVAEGDFKLLTSDIQLSVGGSALSLDQIEHDILRRLDEPQIHFAIVCGARGCPRLMNRAYTARGVTSQLDDNAKHFFADSTKLAVGDDSEVRLSPILQWYADDFGKTPSEVLKTIAPYMPDELKAKLLGRRDLRVRYFDYDWTLNDQAAKSEPPLPPLPAAGDESQPPK